MADEHKKAKGSLSHDPQEEERERHSHKHPHHGFHAEKHPDGTYRVHKHHPDGRVEESAVGGDTEEENLNKVHDLMHEHFMPAEAEGAEQAESGGSPPAEAEPAPEGESA